MSTRGSQLLPLAYHWESLFQFELPPSISKALQYYSILILGYHLNISHWIRPNVYGHGFHFTPITLNHSMSLSLQTNLIQLSLIDFHSFDHYEYDLPPPFKFTTSYVLTCIRQLASMPNPNRVPWQSGRSFANSPSSRRSRTRPSRRVRCRRDPGPRRIFGWRREVDWEDRTINPRESEWTDKSDQCKPVCSERITELRSS